ncbi:hypothetical protein PHET_08712 [Paragonimus heterotremus]|uniref:Uncharacterized protein n=1 Tax=Paragonimus heterotremus TaxID=100268 RepID=A0A8J4SS95_9TREM|nr:hypothetical protein PHET_08712 [Paragonimus heterotremus]
MNSPQICGYVGEITSVRVCFRDACQITCLNPANFRLDRMDLNKIRNYPYLTSTLPSSGSAPLIATAPNEEHILRLRTKKSRPFLTAPVAYSLRSHGRPSSVTVNCPKKNISKPVRPAPPSGFIRAASAENRRVLYSWTPSNSPCP